MSELTLELAMSIFKAGIDRLEQKIDKLVALVEQAIEPEDEIEKALEVMRPADLEPGFTHQRGPFTFYKPVEPLPARVANVFSTTTEEVEEIVPSEKSLKKADEIIGKALKKIPDLKSSDILFAMQQYSKEEDYAENTPDPEQ